MHALHTRTCNIVCLKKIMIIALCFLDKYLIMRENSETGSHSILSQLFVMIDDIFCHIATH